MTTPIGPEPINGTPHSHIKQTVRTIREREFKKYWLNLPSGRQSKNCIRISKKNAKFLLNVSRTRLKIYTGIMTGHYGFNKHLTLIRKRADPSCDFCDFHSDTAEHFLCNCPAFINSRRKHLGGYIIKYDQIRSLQPNDILNYISSTGRFENPARF